VILSIFGKKKKKKKRIANWLNFATKRNTSEGCKAQKYAHPEHNKCQNGNLLLLLLFDTNGQNPLQRGKTEAISTFHYYKAS
jgi:hypothetical protein